jgi:two-component system, NarL family, nitrate/nitrite response regulator NarL
MLRHNALVLASSQLLREALKLGLKRSPFVVIGEGKDLDEAREQNTFAHVPDIVIAVGTNGGSIDTVLEEIRTVSATYPDVKCAIVADHFSSAEVLHVLQAGVDAVLSMDASFSTILSSLKLVMIGQKVFPTLPVHLLVFQSKSPDDDKRPILLEKNRPQPQPPIQGTSYRVPFSQRCEVSQMDVVPSYLPHPVISGSGKSQVGTIVLSDREEQILRCLVNGQPNKVIARELGIAETTVKVHVKSVLRKAQASNRTQAAMWAVNRRFMQPGPRPGSSLVNGVSDDSHTG